jgi:hypothetical protein
MRLQDHPMSGDPDVTDVIDRELRLQQRNVRGAAELLDPAFREFGTSGRVWDRASVIDVMAGDEGPPPVTDDVVATRLADDVILLTYRTREPGRTALRSSVWCRRDGGPWRIVFHQGTVRPAED